MFSPVTPCRRLASAKRLRNWRSVSPYVWRAFCFSCICTRNSEAVLRRRERPRSPGGYGRRSSAIVSPLVPQMLVLSRRDTRALGPV